MEDLGQTGCSHLLLLCRNAFTFITSFCLCLPLSLGVMADLLVLKFLLANPKVSPSTNG